MLMPLIPVIAALLAGGVIVPHAAGGVIVSGAAGYIAGTYLSTAALGTILSVVTISVGATAAALTGVAGAVIGGAGIFGTTIGSSGIIGGLMSVGLISSTPVIVPVTIASVAVGGVAAATFGVVRLRRLKSKINGAGLGQEVIFTEKEAKFIEQILRVQYKKGG